MRPLFSFSLMFCLAIFAPSVQAQDSAASQREIREALEGWREAFNARDAAHVCDIFAPDVIATFQGQPERNHDALCALLRRSLQNPRRTLSYGLEIKEILVAGDLAAVRLIWTLKAASKGGRAVRENKEPGLDIFRREPDGRWRIIRFLAFSERG
ncbi:SgcJ/EcaC family oxidoreductase [Methylocystis heyeri]|uniref:SgcJ/EcaC family oxidoreductase n=1 Tax=Methylocystis heyeri TaxID=391905 RepID=A0A6B8KIH7_9HYPH|nr:SgcJ/EcaC family oxidoreductase [Methylocystis heyeri]QGM47289.1 SgcJ/EcaC family oxidoreductase [Methylocystis heyeri]